MITKLSYKFFIGLTAVIILVVGLFLGTSLTSNLESSRLEAVKIGLSFTSVFLLLIVSTLALEIRESLQAKNKK